MLSEGGEALFSEVDISDEDSVDACVRHVTEQLGGIDILLNNAALYGALDFSDRSAEALQRVYDVNLHGTWRMSRTVAPVMVEARHGRIINVASTTAYLHSTPMDPAADSTPTPTPCPSGASWA